MGQPLEVRGQSRALHVAEVCAPFGSVVVTATVDELVAIDLSLEPCVPTECFVFDLLRDAAGQIVRFFEQKCFEFSLPLSRVGTPYQRAVWSELQAIAAGTTRTYADLAATLGSGPRAVAAACRANPFPLIVPCHRVVATAGLGGYCGSTNGAWLEVKRWLLRHEAV